MAENAPTADELLAHTEWLTRLARALVGDAAAGDVVQDTYEVALAKPPRQPGPIRPWLGGVARNVARMATRGRVRRERREDAVALPHASEVPSPEELVARVQMQQRVGKLVLELPEPLRSTLLLRFFEGMNASEIANAQGVAAATVRSRLKDALDRIRATLDAENNNDRGKWAGLLAPLSPAMSHGTAALAGGILVKTSVKIVIAVVVAAVLVVGTRLAGLWGGKQDANPTVAAKPTTAPSPAPKPAAPAQAQAASAREIPAIHDDDPKGTLRLEGQVIDEHDAPVAHAQVAIDANPPIVVETGTDGAFAFDGLIRRDYRIEATAGERYAGPARLRLGDKPEPVTLRMHKGGTVEVAVTERAGGAPVSGAEVELRSTLTWKATTNGDGIAVLKGIGAGWAPLAARAKGLAPAAMMLGTSGNPDTTERVALTLARGAAIAGRVLDEAGKPVGGARVVATNASEPLPVVDPRRDGVTAAADGTFSIPVVSAGTWRLTATAGEYAPVTSVPLTVDGVHAKTGVELRLTSGAVVRGTVIDKAGKPVAGADVSVVAQGFVTWRPRRQAFTDDSGTFTIGGLARRPVDVVAWHESGASAIVPADLTAEREKDLKIVLDVTGAITGTVVDKTGQPIGDAQVVAEPDWSGGTADRAAFGVRGVQEAVTDQGGAFTFPGLPDGSYRVRAARPGANEAALALSAGVVTRPNGAPVKIVVPADGRVIGKVQLADGKAPLAFSITLGATNPVPFAAKDGAFALPAAAGMYSMTISGLGFVTTTKPVTIAEGKDTDVGTITVTAGRSISGRVLDEHGVPVAKATVAAGSLLTGGGADLYIKDESINAKDTETDENGKFVLDGFAPASFTVVAGKAGVGRSASIRLPASPDSATLDLVLTATTGLEGTVTKGGAPLPDTVVIANPIGAVASNFFVVTGPDGTFALDTLSPGAYIVYPMLGGGGNRPKDMYAKKVEVVLGSKAKVDIDATPGTATLGVTVTTDKGTKVPMAQLVTIAAAINPQTVDELRDGTNMPFGDAVVPIYVRGVVDGAATIEGVKPGPHTACVVLGDPRDPSATKFKCAQTKVVGSAGKVAITVPSAWLGEDK
ncbi:MAG: sigma-70 family RNA polymerase sigma factor [Kofleriaceae bacterium]|nr:sigma-70 family RNA polymerase sigma factor [Kofleriaceae bacterium]